MIAAGIPSTAAAVAKDGAADRAFLVETMTRIAGPVLEAGAEGRLQEAMPVREWEKDRVDTAALEALARTLAGLAPWIELGGDETPEGKLRAGYGEMARRALVQATTPGGPGALSFGIAKQADPQALVEAAYIAQALLRAPKTLWEPLTDEEKANVAAALKSSRKLEPGDNTKLRFFRQFVRPLVRCLKSSRKLKPGDNNWQLFPSIVEAALWKYTGDVRDDRLTKGVTKHQEWYAGDGTYGDGAEFHWDYYNSYVIHPMLLDVLDVCREKQHLLAAFHDEQLRRARRYAVVLERLISPEGTFPVIGRSSTYRFAALQGLSDIILRKQLPDVIDPGGARAGINAVVRRMTEAPGTFDQNGWLEVGAVGYQPSMRDGYNNTGSLYLCLTGMLHLGLPPEDPFWTAPAGPWTQQKIWSGQEVQRDSSMAQ